MIRMIYAGRVEGCSGEREEGRTAEDLGERSESADGQENEQKTQHQRQRDLQYTDDFTGDVLPVPADLDVMHTILAVPISPYS